MTSGFQPGKFLALSEKIEPHSSHSHPNNFPPAVFASSLSKMARINISTCPQAGEKLVLCLKFVPSFSHPFLISFGLEIGAITAIPAMVFR